MTDLAKLVVKLEAESSRLVKQLDTSDKRLKKWENKTSKSVEKVKKAFIGLASVATITIATKKVFETVAAFEKLEASLKTVTGSSEKAATAMSMIRDFTTETPFQVQEVTNAFIKLKALGLTPSEAALKSYGNTASALGKSLNQMIEAVADAATGEFERLKEFGIKAKSQGDNVTFTFQGVAKTVRKNAKEIEGYLKGIGDVQFAGAMSEQMGTISGKTSNLTDKIDNFSILLGKAGLTQIFKDVIDSMSGFVTKISESDGAIKGIVKTVQFFVNVVKSTVLAFADLGNAIGAFAAATGAALAFDFDSMKRILDLRDQENEKNEQALKAIWAKTEATKALTATEEERAGKNEALLAAKQEQNETLIQAEIDHADKLRLLYQKSADDRIKSEQRVQQSITNMRMNTFQQGANLLRLFAGESREAAYAVIAIEKGLAIAQVIMNTEAAKARALAELGPIAGSAAAAKMEVYKNISIGLIVATGLVQASNVGGGGASVGSGANPVSTQDVGNDDFVPQNEQQGVTNINIDGAFLSDEGIDAFIDQIREAGDRRDKIIVSRNSRNGQELAA